MFITQANTPVKMPIAARMVEYGVLKLIVLKRAKTIDGAMSLIATMHSIISRKKKQQMICRGRRFVEKRIDFLCL